MSLSRVLQIALILESIILVVNAIVIQRDYQDSWILEGLEIPFTLFVSTFLIYIFKENRVIRLLPFALTFRAMFFLIPNLKYPWFQGVAVDQQQHYGLMMSIYDNGHILNNPMFNSTFEYSGTPLMHLLLTEFSKVTSFSPLIVFKYLPFAIWLVYPVLILILITKILKIENNHPAAKYALILSSIPYYAGLTYDVMGITIGLLLVLLFLFSFTQASYLKDRKYLLLAITFSFALITAHAFSSLTMLVGLAGTYVIYLLVKNRIKINLHWLNPKILVFLTIANISWLYFLAPRLYDQASTVVSLFFNSVLGRTSNLSALTGLYPRFFELGSFDALRIILLYYAPFLVLIPIILFGVLTVFRKFRYSAPLVFLSIYVATLWLFLGFQMGGTLFRAGLLEYVRIPIHTLILAPLFFAILLYQINRTSRRTKVAIMIIPMIVALSVIQVFNPPQFVPAANAVVKDLPSDVPLVCLNNVNSIYQRSMIYFTGQNIQNGLIASDAITYIQVYGLLNYSFLKGNMLYYYYPYSRIIDSTIPKQEFDYFMIHLPGKSGSFQEKAEIRTPELIDSGLQNCSLIYNNGESFLTTKPFLDVP